MGEGNPLINPDETDPVEASRHFDERLEARLGGIELSLQRRRIYGLILGLIAFLTTTLSITAITAAVKSTDASGQANQAIQNGYTTCLGNNVYRADDLKGWNQILVLVSSLHTATNGEVKVVVDGITNIVHKKDRLRNCKLLLNS